MIANGFTDKTAQVELELERLCMTLPTATD
jgi:hypothetical protein